MTSNAKHKLKTLKRFHDFIESLEARNLHYNLSIDTPRTIRVMIYVPGERWEVEFPEDGEPEIEVYVSRAGVETGVLNELFDRFSE